MDFIAAVIVLYLDYLQVIILYLSLNVSLFAQFNTVNEIILKNGSYLLLETSRFIKNK